MNAEMLKALKNSIASWEKRRETDDWGSEACALCIYAGTLRLQGQTLDGSRCHFCIIGQLDGIHSCCYNTPYWKASSAYSRWLEVGSDETLKTWHEAADAEIAFLKSLLPKVAKKGGGK